MHVILVPRNVQVTFVVLVKMKYNHDSQCLQLSFISCRVARFAEELTSNVLIAATMLG